MGDQESIEDSAGYWITRLARSMEQDFEQRLQAIGITRGAYAVLSAIYHDKKTTPAVLSSFLGVDGGAVTRLLDRIERQGLIQRKQSARDRRSVDIILNPEGVRVVNQGREDSRATNEKFTDGLSASEVDALKSLIRAMLANGKQMVTDI